MREFLDYILQIGDLNKQDVDLITSKATKLELHKEEYFSEAGKIPGRVGFVIKGIFRFFYYNNKGEEITNSFIDENNFVTDYQKFEANMVASEYVQAATNCTLIVFSRKDWEEISNTIVGWDKIEAQVIKKCLTEAIESRSPLVSQDATTRYLSFLQRFPNVVNRVPLSYIASYLGITQQSLSRIRKNIR